jgi:L-asparagine oxygenase
MRRSPADSRLVLGADEAARLLRLARTLAADPAVEPLAFCAQARAAARCVPRRVAASLRRFAVDGGVGASLLVAGLPVGRVPPTPTNNGSHVGETTELARVQAILGSVLGELIAYEAEGAGRLFQDVVPNPALADRQQSQSSAVELECHTEQAFSPLRPDWLSLACLRDDPRAVTYLMSARALTAALPHADIARLREPLWELEVDESFRHAAEFVLGEHRGPVPVVHGPAHDPRIVFDSDLMSGVTSDAHALLAEIARAYPRLRSAHVLRAGDILFVDNRRAVHGRSPFAARYDGTDRFLVRGFVVASLARSAHARAVGSRTVVARFS